jgi:1-deoxy-D-xylulose-5-phosphate synthase
MNRRSKTRGDAERPDERAGEEPPARLLDGIDGPADLHSLSEQQLAQLAQEVRTHIIDTVGEIGGHFGANLGTCELAVALHSLLDSPNDKILWDVGHQAYPHKVLTGRRERLGTIRQYGGLAPFCSIGESPHDIMGAGHASTSIGYAVGIKEAMRHSGDPEKDGKVVAVIGDGGMTGGVAFEAIGQAGGLGTPITVVLNDNGMSIAPNVGALSRYFNRIRLNPRLWHARSGVEGGLKSLPGGIGAAFERLGPQLKESIKAFWAPGLWWEELDWAYMGVIDGHDVHALRVALREALAAQRPVVVHIATVKGKGFAPAEDGGLEGMEKWHAAKPNSIVDGKPAPARPAAAARADVARAWKLVAQLERLSPAEERATYLPRWQIRVAGALARAGLPDSADAVIRRARAAAPHDAEMDFDEAEARMLLGDREAALRLLARDAAANPQYREYIRVYPVFRPLWTDPRFRALLQKPAKDSLRP